MTEQALSALNPTFLRGSSGKGYLSFDCPRCAALGQHESSDLRPMGEQHRINGLPTFDGEPRNTGIYRWGLTGSPPDWDSVTLTPSVNFENDHWHGFVTNGIAQ